MINLVGGGVLVPSRKHVSHEITATREISQSDSSSETVKLNSQDNHSIAIEKRLSAIKPVDDLDLGDMAKKYSAGVDLSQLAAAFLRSDDLDF